MDDVKTIRKIIADRDYEKARADEAVKQADAWKTSAGNWQSLYEKEKQRADVTQEGRIAELTKANMAYRDQADADKQRLGEQDFKIRKLKSERKWWFAAGAGTGVAAGFAGGYQLGRIRF